MSNDVLNWAKRVTVGGQTRKAVFLLLADHADEKGRAWPSQETIATTLEMSERTVRTAIKELVDAGLLSRKARWRPDGTRGTDILRFDMDLVNRQEMPVMADQPANGAKPTGKSRQINRQMAPQQPAADAGKPSQGEPPEGIPHNQNGSEAIASGLPAVAATPSDLSDRDRLWAEGRMLLIECSLTSKLAGDMIGRWLGTYRDPIAILAAIRAARHEGSQAPIPYVVAVLEAPERKARASPSRKSANPYFDMAFGDLGGSDEFGSGPHQSFLRISSGSRH